MEATLTDIDIRALRVVLYLRVSHDRSGYARSVSEQEAELRAQAVREGWEIVAVFEDPDFSASRHARKNRPDYAELVKFVEAGRCDMVAVWESSRLQRDLSNYVQLRDLCYRSKVLWSYKGRVYDMSRTDDRFQTGLDALIDERYSDETRDRILRNMRSNATKGRPHGKLLYGYQRRYHPKTKEFIEQIELPEQAAVVREAKNRVLAGQTITKVAADFERRGIPVPSGAGHWIATTIKRMLINPGYAGKRVHQGKVIGDGVWPAIITEDEHYRLVAMLTASDRTMGRPTAVKHLLSGIALCGSPGCDTRVTCQMNRGAPAYICFHGFHVSRKESDVDAVVERAIIKRLRRPDAVALLNADSRETVRRQAAQDELAVLQGRLDEFVASAVAPGGITAATLARIESELQPKIDAARRKAQPAEQAPTVVAELIGKPDIAERWERLDLAQQRAVIKSLVRIRILPAGKGHRSFDPKLIEIKFLGSR